MPKINFHNKTFLLLENSAKGTVNADTVFRYQQTGNIVTADYEGGTIQYGKIIAVLKGDQLDMLYQCITTENELKAGKALADIEFTDEDKIKLKLNWQWLGEEKEHGISEYLER